MSNAELEAGYQRWFIADAYDALALAVFAPVGGLDALRVEALDRFGIGRGTRVLELGCGSGGVTALLCERGATVTAVDWSEPMLKKAALRAPGCARFVRSSITAYEPEPGAYDVVLFAFVLHELDASARAEALQVARRARRPRGRVAIVDHALPKRGTIARLMSRVVHGFEPPTSRGQWLSPNGPENELCDAGFFPDQRVSLASGMAFAVTGR